MKELKPDAPSRDVTEVGAGDYVKIGSSWHEIRSNSAYGRKLPREWTVETIDGHKVGMYGIRRYAKAEDITTEKPFRL